MRFTIAILIGLGFFLQPSTETQAREWSTENGEYKLKADLIAFNDSSVILKDEAGKLLTVELDELSEEDRKFVESEDTSAPRDTKGFHTWTSSTGLKVPGKIVAYGKQDLVVQRRLGKLMINENAYTNLPPLHQRIVRATLSHFENTEFDEESLSAWARNLGAQSKTYPLEGVLMQLQNGEKVQVPFFLFNEKDLAVLEPGWKTWLAHAEDEDARRREDLMVQTHADNYQNYQQQQPTSEEQYRRDMLQIEAVKLQMMGQATGLIKVWQVNLVPFNTMAYRPIAVMVTANDSATATAMALQQYPGYQVASVKRSRRFYAN